MKFLIVVALLGATATMATPVLMNEAINDDDKLFADQLESSWAYDNDGGDLQMDTTSTTRTRTTWRTTITGTITPRPPGGPTVTGKPPPVITITVGPPARDAQVTDTDLVQFVEETVVVLETAEPADEAAALDNFVDNRESVTTMEASAVDSAFTLPTEPRTRSPVETRAPTASR